MMKKGYVIPLREKFAYGSGDLAVNLAFDSINFYMLWFIVSVAGIPAGMAGLIFMIARVWDAATDFAVAGIPLIVDIVLASKAAEISYFYMGIFFGLIMMVILVVTGTVSKERVEGERSNYDTFFKTIVSFFKLKEFRQVSGSP